VTSFVVISQHLLGAAGEDHANHTVVGVSAVVTTPEYMSVSLPLDPMSTWHRHRDVCSVELRLCPRPTVHRQSAGPSLLTRQTDRQTALNLANAESLVFWGSALRNETECHSNSRLSSVLNILLYAVITPSLFPPSPSQL
jgi:hypothetical protein